MMNFVSKGQSQVLMILGWYLPLLDNVGSKTLFESRTGCVRYVAWLQLGCGNLYHLQSSVMTPARFVASCVSTRSIEEEKKRSRRSNHNLVVL